MDNAYFIAATTPHQRVARRFQATCFTLAAAVLLSAAAQPLYAHSVTTPPTRDMRAFLPFDGDPQFFYTMMTESQEDANWIQWGMLHNEMERSVGGVTYSTSTKGDFTKGIIVITTIFGEDFDPRGQDLLITGYDPTAMDITMDTNSILGKSGKVYAPSRSDWVPTGKLQSYLGTDFDTSIFEGDPESLVRVFQTAVPASDMGAPSKGILLKEDFSKSPHVGDSNGAFGAGYDLTGTLFTVTSGNVDILGSLNGSNGRCDANPSGNCLDLIGNEGAGAVEGMAHYSLDPQYTYLIQFDVAAQDVASDLHLAVSLGQNFWQEVTATPKPQAVQFAYTPQSVEADAVLGLASLDKVDDIHGPVISNFVMCAVPVGTAKLKCPKGK